MCFKPERPLYELTMTITQIDQQITPYYWSEAVEQLKKQDLVLSKLISDFEGEILYSRGDAFTTLARSIVGQQISVKAAASVWKKLVCQFSEITPSRIFSADIDQLRACGLSARKANYIRDLSTRFLDGIYDEAKWQSMNDESLINLLIQFNGIGRWTAEMFLIFYMLRPDVLPLADIGLQRAVSIHYHHNQSVDSPLIIEIAKNWQPWRSVATWYLWRSLDPIPVAY